MKRWTLTALVIFAPLGWGCGQPADSTDGVHGQALVPTAQEIEAACDAADADAQASKPHKVTICHIPPGNPDNAHTINISKKAVRAHLDHGDVLGGCGCSDDGGAGDEPEQDPGEPNTGGGDDDTTVPPSPGGPTPSTEPDEPPSDSSGDPSDAPDSGADMCDADQTTCESVADCGNNQTCDATSGCCVEVYL